MIKHKFKIDDIPNDRTIFETDLVVSFGNSYTVHKITIKENIDTEGVNRQYLVFEYVSGTAVTGWVDEHFEKANRFFDIGDKAIFYKDSPSSITINVRY